MQPCTAAAAAPHLTLTPVSAKAAELRHQAEAAPGTRHNAGAEISIRIGQRVRHQDYNGQRVTGVVHGLSVDDRALLVDIALDTPIVIPASGDMREIKLYRQHVPAHELAPFDERDELIAEMLAALQGVVRVADRATVEFDAARAAIVKATGSAA